MECGECTLCCKLLNIKDVDSKPGEYCKHCKPGIGCKIYNERPEPCRIFECAWKQMIHTGEELRPDRCNILFEKWSDYVMVGSVDSDDIKEIVIKQIDYFRSEGISVLIVNQNIKTRTYFLAPEHDKDFVRKEINGSTKLYRRLK